MTMNFLNVVKLLTKNGLVTDRFLPYNPNLKGVCDDSRNSANFLLFVCIEGTYFDSHSVASNTPAAAFICQKPINTDKPFVVVKDSRLALALISYEFYGKTYEKLKSFSVTGTKGKTTAAMLFKEIVSFAGKKCALTSTVLNSTPFYSESSEHTTQSSLYTAKLLNRALKEGAEFASIEVSSQGLEMKRLDGYYFDRVAFLNLTRDHFDTHVNFENYFNAKAHLLDLVKPNGIVFVNLNGGKWANRYASLARDKGLKVVTYGRRGDVILKVVKENDDGIIFTLKLERNFHEFFSPVIGGFMAENMTASILAAHSFGIDLEIIKKAVKDFKGVEGRLERYCGEGYDFYVDFAHTPAALETVLKTVKKLAKGRVIVVFGAGGEADRGKRPLMGKMAQQYADVIFLTNDNPKSEDPMVIISEVASGISKKSKLSIVPDRKKAIKEAFMEWRKGDRVVIAGRGHEKTQIFDGYEIPFNDKDVAFEILKEMRRLETFGGCKSH